jgi:hypothetical protein
MGTFADTENVDYCTVYRLSTKENKLPFPIGENKMDVNVFRIYLLK